MQILPQILILCSVSLVLGGTLVSFRGLPSPAVVEASPEGMCTAPATQAAAEAVTWVDQDAARASLGDPGVLFIDCRPTAEFQAGHIAGALSLPTELENLDDQWLAVLRSARTVIAYCDATGGCASSVRLAERLTQLGVADMRILRGGLPEWLASGYPAESGACPMCPRESSQ
jgi:3-mercaptopyruvate sulfurtransferase SseA